MIRILVGLHGYSDISTYERFEANKIEDTLWSVGPPKFPTDYGRPARQLFNGHRP